MKKAIQIFFLLVCSFSLHAQIAIINEFSSDPTMFDGAGGEFVELYCPAGGGNCDISCWVVSDGQGLVTIPTGTIIPDGGYYLIAHAPAFNCDSCDFFGIPIDLNTATCGCLSGGRYGVGVDGNPSLVIGRGQNAGELMLLYNNLGVLLESWKFDNASAAMFPTGGNISSVGVGACPPTIINIIDPNDPAVIDVGPVTLGCNTSYTRSTDGSGTWVIDDHPTPGATNSNRGTDAFEFQYRIDGGAWVNMAKAAGNNIHNDQLTICAGNSIEFRIQIENYQHAVLEVFDSSGRYGSYFEAPGLGIIPWATVTGLGAALGDLLFLQSGVIPIAAGNNDFKLQWSDFKDGQGSFSATSTNECYERMNFSLRRNIPLDSAHITCVDGSSGLSAVTIFPTGLDVTYVLYDDIGDMSNPIFTNQTGLFAMSPTDTPAVAHYVVVTGDCNSVTAIDMGSAFCKAVQPCPQITSSSYLKNGAACGAAVLTNLHTESFEGPVGVGYSATGVFSDGSDDYFDLIGLAPDPTGVPAYIGRDGARFWGGEDTQDVDNPNASGISGITISGINIANTTSLQLEGLFAAGSSTAYDNEDYIQIFARIDGGAFVLIGAFEGAGGFNTTLRLDANLDGIGEGTILTTTFQNFVFPITGTGSTLDIRIDVFMSAGDEAIGFDNLRVSGMQPTVCNACPGDVLSFSVTGTNLPRGGFIEWYTSTTPNFNPYAGQGTQIGSSNIPNTASCASGSLAINEIMYRPLFNNGNNPDAGEYIELIGPPGMDLSCFVLTDGDWTITIPPGYTIPADGIFTIGNFNVYGPNTFDLDAENCGCFNDAASGSGLLIFTDGGEYLAVFDGAGTFVQGVIFGSPTAGNTPPNGALVVGSTIPTVGLAGCPGSVVIPGPGAFQVGPVAMTAAGTSLIRDPDGTGAWTTQAGGSVNACNSLGASLGVPPFDYTIPLEACNELRYYKGIINPHPNTLSCPNTNPTAFTSEFEVQVTCPTATISGDYAVCENALPISIPVSTTGLLSPIDASFLYYNAGNLDTASVTVTNDTFYLNVNNTGTFAGFQLIPTSGCAGVADSFATVSVIPIPGIPSLPSPVTVCEGDTVIMTATGGASFEWSFIPDFSTIDGTGTEFLLPAPDQVFVRSINQDDSATVTCMGGNTNSIVNTMVCDPLLNQNLLYFELRKLENKAILDWAVYSNEPVLGAFVLERSQDAIHFEVLKEVPALMGGGTNYYQFTDESPYSGWNYYRLKLPSYSFSDSYSANKVAYFDKKNGAVLVYPSPFSNSFHIEFLGEVPAEPEIKLIDALGRTAYQAHLSAGTLKNEVKLKDLPAGVYMLQIDLNGAVQVHKLVKE